MQNVGLREISCWWIFPDNSVSSVLSPFWATATPLPPQETLQDQWVGLAYAPVNSLLFPWNLVHARTCVYPARVECLFPPVPWSNCNQALLAFKAKCSEGFSSLCQNPKLGILTWDSELNPVGELLYIIILQFWVTDPCVMRFDYIGIVPLLPSHCGFFIVFGCRISCLLGSSLFNDGCRALVVLLCSWGEVSSRFLYSIIFSRILVWVFQRLSNEWKCRSTG